MRRYSFEQGLTETVEWYRQNRGWWERVRQKKEHQNLMQDWYAQR